MSTSQARRVPIPSKLPQTFPAPLRTRLENTLIRSESEPVPRLLSTLESSLHNAGWDKKLVSHVMKRVQERNDEQEQQTGNQMRMTSTVKGRSVLHSELLEEVLKGSRPVERDERMQVAKLDDELRIPQAAVDAAVGVLKEELERMCEVDDDKYVDWRTSIT